MKTMTFERAEVRTFSLPKAGSRAEEYEDAIATSSREAPDADGPLRFAVADGATESAFARRWARLLAEGFVGEGPAAFDDALPTLRAAWADAVDAHAQTLPWYAAAKASEGAFAALLGLSLHLPSGGQPGSWQAANVGDANLFHVRDESLQCAWPRTRPEEFDAHPALLASRSGPEPPALQTTDGLPVPGDTFVLATDAAAAWLLRTDPARAFCWDTADAFAEAVQTARADGSLKNDDTTILTVRLA